MKLSLVLVIVGIHCIVMTHQQSDERQYLSTQLKCSPQYIDTRMRIMDVYTRYNELCGITTTSATTTTTTTTTTKATTTTQATTCPTTTTTTTPACSSPPTLVTLRQLYSSAKMDHFVVASGQEVRDAEAMGYIRQPSPGKVTRSTTCPCGTTLTPVYRLFNPTSNDHFYTTSSAEENSATTLGYTKEGIKFYCSPTKGLCGATLPLFRLRNGGDHIYVTDPTQAAGAIFEDITCYIWPS